MSLQEERPVYAGWVNVMVSILLPGSAHFLAGRKGAAAVWFLANFLMGSLTSALYASPFAVPIAIFILVRFLLWVATIIDGCRKPIPRRNFKTWASFCFIAVAVAAVPFVTIRQFIFRPFLIPTAAMEPTLMGNRKTPDGQLLKGDRVIVNRWTYHFHPPQRGDVAVFKTEAIVASEREKFRISTGEIYVKRIVGLPGERISIRPPDVLVNGQKLREPKVFETMFSQANDAASTTQLEEVQLGAGEYYVIGDNMTNSLDSRYYGPIKSGYFIGKVGWIYGPPERRGFMQ